MAITKLGGTLAGIRGTIGGVTYSANGSGTYAKAWERPTNPQSTLQTRRRGPLTTMGNAWRALSDGERTAWNNYALEPAELDTNSLGDPVTLSGFAWFCRVNLRRNLVGAGIQTAIPTSSRPATPTAVVLTIHNPFTAYDACKCYFTSGIIPYPNLAILEVAIGSGQGMAVQTSGYRTLYHQTAGWADHIIFTDVFLTAFGTIPLTMKVFTHLVRQTTDGIRSLPAPASCLVTSP